MSVFRSLWRSPGFLVTAVLTLGLGIGVNIACFGVVRAVLMKPLGYREPDRLVLISGGARITAHIDACPRFFLGGHNYSDRGRDLRTYFVLGSQRVREMGIRRALGARRSDLVAIIIRQALIIALSGIAVGSAGALGTTRFLKSYLFHTSAMDPIALLVVSGVFAVVTLAAALTPAVRAAKVDPAVALRYE